MYILRDFLKKLVKWLTKLKPVFLVAETRLISADRKIFSADLKIFPELFLKFFGKRSSKKRSFSRSQKGPFVQPQKGTFFRP